MSGIGTKRTYPGKLAHVRFERRSGHAEGAGSAVLRQRAALGTCITAKFCVNSGESDTAYTNPLSG